MSNIFCTFAPELSIGVLAHLTSLSSPLYSTERYKNMSKQLQIRNSTAEFLIFQAEDKAEGVQVFYKDESIWATQKAMATLFDCSTDNIGLHLKNIFESGELICESVIEKISATAADGKNYLTQFYKSKQMTCRKSYTF